MKKISIVVPCFNEASGILLFIEGLAAVVKSLAAYQIEAIFVDDGSTDATYPMLSRACDRYSWIRIVSFTRNFGKEAALTAGLDFASGDAVVFMDADLQHPPEIIQKFIAHWELGAHVVLGKRLSRQTDSWTYGFLAELFYRLHNRIAEINLPRGVGDFRLIDEKVAAQIKLLGENQRFMKGLFAWVGYEPVFVDYFVAPRASGRSTYSKWRSWNFALEGITSFSTVPLRIWSYVGLVILVVGLGYSLLIVGDAIFRGVQTPGYVTLLTAVVVFGGVQLIGLGILGEYVGRIYMEVKGRPSYLVENIKGQTQVPTE